MIRVSIVTDVPFLESPEEEWERIAGVVRETLRQEIEVVYTGFDILAGVAANPDLFLIDYGGMTTSGARDTAVVNIRYACRWAEEHPSRLLVLWTWFTGQAFEDEILPEIGELANIKRPKTMADGRHELVIGDWFGIGHLDVLGKPHKLKAPGRRKRPS